MNRCILLISTVFPLLSAAGLNAGITRITPPVIQHGTIPMGTIIEDTIRFINSGQQRLMIENIVTNCGCTAAELKKKEIAPGDTASIPYFFDSRGYRGHVRKYIMIHFQDNDPRPLSFTLELDVLEELSLTPRYLYLPREHFNPDSTIVRTFTLHNNTGRKITITGIQTFNTQLKVFPGQCTIGAGSEYTFKIHFRPTESRPSHWNILVHTDYIPMPELKLPFYVTFKE